jgi:hypothetical protein
MALPSPTHTIVIDRRSDSPIRRTLSRGEAIELDVSALRSDAVIEVQCGVSVVARRDSTSENAARLRIEWAMIERLGAEPSLQVFVSTPTVEHGRTLAVAPLPERYAQLDLRLHDPRAMDWASAVAPAVIGAVTVVEALLAVGRASAGRTAFALGCGLASIALLARWGAVIARKLAVRAAWRWAGVAATAMALLPYFVGVRELRIGPALLPTIEDRLVLSSDRSALGSEPDHLDEPEALLGRRRAPRWSERWLSQTVRRAHRPRFVRTDARSAQRLGVERYVRCESPERCVFDAREASTEAGIRIAPPALGAAATADHVAIEARLSSLSLEGRRTFTARAGDDAPLAVQTSFAPAGELRYWANGQFTVSARIGAGAGADERGAASTRFFQVPEHEVGRFASFNGVNVEGCGGARSLALVGLAPALAHEGALFEPAGRAREFTVDCSDPNRLGALASRSVLLASVRTAGWSAGESIEVPSNASIVALRDSESMEHPLVGAARCPESADEQHEMHVLSRVFGLPAERGLALAPLEESKRDVGGWTPFDRAEAAEYATVCRVLRGETLPRAHRAFGSIRSVDLVVRPLRVAVGSLVRPGPPRIATLVPRYRSARVAVVAMVGRFMEFAGFDLRFE